jgi:hypothetical protein
MLASRLENDSMSYDVFPLIPHYANLAPASSENLLEIAQGFQSTGHEHLMLQSVSVQFSRDGVFTRKALSALVEPTHTNNFRSFSF